MKRIAIAFLVFLLCVSVASASSSETAIDAVSSGSDSGIGILSVSYTITQGQTNWHYKPITSSVQSFNVDLNWGDKTDSLKLYIYDPSYNLIGYYYDSADGKRDGRINIDVVDNSGIEQGTWTCRVYGYSVSGTEDYSI
ncbi:peptidase domain-containing protein [Methanolobus sediminis]|uniref:Peptidase domain-containing protein n=1 Tax=Methanolobus sediminis TaxID=3072978 RepID=A0AA51UNN1_9EURY|nr:peptidase domain-containing protein [Methanolobus sediminis]WMW25400.1 peptidase domain-containing protein [Methanolobus sediminis]